VGTRRPARVGVERIRVAKLVRLLSQVGRRAFSVRMCGSPAAIRHFYERYRLYATGIVGGRCVDCDGRGSRSHGTGVSIVGHAGSLKPCAGEGGNCK